MKKIYLVAKFGGSSMADISAMERSAKIAIANCANLIVVSATYKTTDHLLNLVTLATLPNSKNWEEIKQAYALVQTRHFDMLKEADPTNQLKNSLTSIFNEGETLLRGIFLLKDCPPKTLDSFLSLGERSSSIIFSQVLQNLTIGKFSVQLLDARSVLKTNSNFGQATPQIDLIRAQCTEKVIPFFNQGSVVVTQGFLGSDGLDITTTLGRGGSDYSAALLAEGIYAKVLQIWTDVAGIATTDPRICKDAVCLPEISFTEAAELATFGAKILHPTTLAPAERSNIKVFVGSTFNPEAAGTWIKQRTNSAPLVRAMALKKNQSLLILSTPKMLHATGFLFSVFKVFYDHNISIDLITTSEISIALTLDDSTLLNSDLIDDLSNLGKVTIEEQLALVSLVGNNINHTPGLANNIFKTLPEINIRMICFGASKHNFSFLVPEKNGEEAITKLHSTFISHSTQMEK